MSLPQLSGTPGWIFLTHDENGVASAYFVDAHGTREEEVAVVMDERICCDTLFRVVRLSPKMFVLYDIVLLNGKNIHDILSFTQRHEKLRGILDIFHFPDLTAFVLPEDAPLGSHVRGYEMYDGVPGTNGVFVEHLPVEE